jgi:hypothetical protein
VKRNIERFTDDFMFQLTKEELDSLRSQIVTTIPAEYHGIEEWRSQFGFIRQMHRSYRVKKGF